MQIVSRLALWVRVTFAIGVSCFLLVGLATGQAESTVIPGKSFDTIKIGESTEQDVVANYGTDYKLVKHKSYSYEMRYRQRRLSFYYCSADPRKEIFVVEIQDPATAVTDNGIRLGVDKMEKVFDAYGKPEYSSVGFEYPGVYFSEELEDKDAAVPDARDVTRDAEVSNAAVKTVDAVNAENTASNIVPPLSITNTASTKTTSNNANNSIRSDNLNNAASSNNSNNLNNTANSSNVNNAVNSDRWETRSNANSSNNAGVNNNNDSESDENDQIVNDMKEAKTKILRRIELIEASGLRQCDSRFPQKQ